MQSVIRATVSINMALFVTLASASCLPEQRTTDVIAPRKTHVGKTGTLRERAERLWAAKVAEDWQAVFALLDPRMTRGMVEADFAEWSRNNEPFVIHSFSLGPVLTDGDLGWVQVDYSATIRRFPDLPSREAQLWEKWQLFEGQWYPIPPQELSAYPETPAIRDQVEEGRLLSRFMDSWDARSKGDWGRLYELTDPRDRSAVPEEEFAEVEGLFKYFSYDLQWVEVIGNRGRVRVSYDHEVTDPSLSKLPPRTETITENWVKYENEWYRDLKRP